MKLPSGRWPGKRATRLRMAIPCCPPSPVSGANYDLRGQMAYQINPHWFAGTYFEANDTRDYNLVSVGFFVRFLFRQQPSTATAPTGIFPVDGLRPFTVP